MKDDFKINMIVSKVTAIRKITENFKNVISQHLLYKEIKSRDWWQLHGDREYMFAFKDRTVDIFCLFVD